MQNVIFKFFGSSAGSMLGENPLASPAAQAAKFAIICILQQGNDVNAVLCHENLFANLKEGVQPEPPVGDNRGAACRRFK